MTFTRVDGKTGRKILLYTLSTCMWCRMAKKFLNENGVGYEYVDVDLLQGEEKEAAKKEIRRWNPSGSYPTIVIDDKDCLCGFDEKEIKEKIL